MQADDECVGDSEVCAVNALQRRAWRKNGRADEEAEASHGEGEAAKAAKAEADEAARTEAAEAEAAEAARVVKAAEAATTEDELLALQDRSARSAYEAERSSAEVAEEERAQLEEMVQGCRGVGSICWVNAQCCSGRCIRTNRCGPRVR